MRWVINHSLMFVTSELNRLLLRIWLGTLPYMEGTVRAKGRQTWPSSGKMTGVRSYWQQSNVVGLALTCVAPRTYTWWWVILEFVQWNSKRLSRLWWPQEPGWNPAVANQAIDRLYRLGQRHEVHVINYFTIGSIEANIQEIRKRKHELGM